MYLSAIIGLNVVVLKISLTNYIQEKVAEISDDGNFMALLKESPISNDVIKSWDQSFSSKVRQNILWVFNTSNVVF